MRRLALAFAVAALALGSTACPEKGAGEKAGKAVDDAVDKLTHPNEGPMEKAGRKLDDQTALNVCQRTRRHDQTAIARTCKRRDGPLDLAGVANVERAHVHAD